MTDTVHVRVAGPQFRYDYDWYEHGDELDVPPETLEQYPRRLERVEDEPDADGDEGSDTGDETPTALDVGAFVDRTPMEDVIADIESGEYDDHLDGIQSAEADGRGRKGVLDAIQARREE